MNKKILISLSIIGIVGAIAIGATIAYFSDTETSAGNIFVAGAMDLKVDHKFASYNGKDCIEECIPGEVNLLQTIGFEDPVVTHSANWDIFPSPVGGWVVEWYGGATSYGGLERPELANLEYHRGVLGAAYEGEQYVELDSDWYGPNSSQTGEPASVKIYQDVATTPGKDYQIMFAFAPRPNTPASDNHLEIKWNGVVVDILGPVAGASGPINWTVHSYDVTASGNTSRLEFTDLGTPNSVGTFIDHIQLYEYICTYQIIGGSCKLWDEKDLEEGDTFWNFDDVKPGDYGINVISLHVYDNDAFACLMAHNIVDLENELTDPEIKAGDTTEYEGELSQFMKIFAWEDDGDGVYNVGDPIITGPNSLFSAAIGAIDLTACDTKYIGIAWCLGTQSVDGEGVIYCDGSTVSNIVQTDTMMADFTAYAEQQRNNAEFSCPDWNSSPQ